MSIHRAKEMSLGRSALCENSVIAKTTKGGAVSNDDGKDYSGNFIGITPQQARDAGVNSTDNWASAIGKVEQHKNDELRARLEQEGYSPTVTSCDPSEGSGAFKLVFFSLLSFGLICDVAWHAFGYLLGVFVYPKGATTMLSQDDISKRSLFIIGGLFIAGCIVWFKSVKFFRRSFIKKR